MSADVDPDERGLYLDSKAALDMLQRDGIGPDRIALWGMSLGTGVAVEMARQRRARSMVLVAPYTSLPDLATRWAPYLPGPLIVRDRFDSLGKAPQVDIPVLVIHGDGDRVVPFDMGRTLAAAFPNGRFVAVEGVGHHNVFERDARLYEAVFDHLRLAKTARR